MLFRSGRTRLSIQESLVHHNRSINGPTEIILIERDLHSRVNLLPLLPNSPSKTLMFLRREHSLFQLAYWKYRSILSLKSYLKMTEFSCHAFLFLPFEGVIPNDIYDINSPS